MRGNNDFFEIFERNKYLKKIPSMQRVKRELAYIVDLSFFLFSETPSEGAF